MNLTKILDMVDTKILDIVDKIPVVNLVPLIIKLLSSFPDLWENLPDEKKQELFNALVAAGAKAASNYAKSE